MHPGVTLKASITRATSAPHVTVRAQVRFRRLSIRSSYHKSIAKRPRRA
jgi:hypothetical protein